MPIVFFYLFQCADNAREEVDEKLRSDDPSTVWLTLDGWSAETTSYIGVEICMKYKCRIFTQDGIYIAQQCMQLDYIFHGGVHHCLAVDRMKLGKCSKTPVMEKFC